MTITREEIEACMAPEAWPSMLRHREDAALFKQICRLAILGLAASGDAKLGAAMRVVVSEIALDVAPRTLDATASRLAYCGERHAAAIVCTIATHLREESR